MKPADGPPVNEVVLAICFDEQDVLAGPKLLVALRELTSNYPEIEEQPPYEMPDELPTKSQLQVPPMARIQLITQGGIPVKRRYWLTRKDNASVLIQVQSDYFAVNWRSRPDGQSYPGFARLKAIFSEALRSLNEAVTTGGGGDLVIRQIELAYINIIKASDDDPPGRNLLSDYLSLDAPFLDTVEQLNLTYTRSLDGPEGDFFGRSYTAIQTAYQVKGGLPSLARTGLSSEVVLAPVLNVNTSVRSVKYKELSFEQLDDVLEQAHAEATNSFRSITTATAQESWGLL